MDEQRIREIVREEMAASPPCSCALSEGTAAKLRALLSWDPKRYVEVIEKSDLALAPTPPIVTMPMDSWLANFRERLQLLSSWKSPFARNPTTKPEISAMSKADRKYEWVTEAVLTSVRAGNTSILNATRDALQAYDHLFASVETIPPKQDGFGTVTQ
jgi:hypothetical protein